MSGYDTTVNTAIQEMLSIFTTISTDEGPYGPDDGTQQPIEVVDGSPVEYVSNYILSVTGMSGWEQEWWTVGGDLQRLEHYDLECQAHCWQGNSDPPTRRTEAFYLVNQVRAALYTQLQPGSAGILGLPMGADAAIQTGELIQGPAEGTSGWGVDLNFIVHVQNVILS